MAKLIDVDELKEWVKNWFEKNRYYHSHSKANNIPIPELYDILERMPIADTKPVRHGEWTYLYDGNYKCSECGSWWTCDGTPIESGLLYCPNCGAKMNEVKDAEKTD